jgi:hypothetical protein
MPRKYIVGLILFCIVLNAAGFMWKLFEPVLFYDEVAHFITPFTLVLILAGCGGDDDDGDTNTGNTGDSLDTTAERSRSRDRSGDKTGGGNGPDRSRSKDRSRDNTNDHSVGVTTNTGPSSARLGAPRDPTIV